MEYRRRRCPRCGAVTVHSREGWGEIRADALVLVRVLAWVVARPLVWWLDPWVCQPCYLKAIRAMPDEEPEDSPDGT